MPILLSLLTASSIEAQYPTTESGTPLFCYAETTNGEIVDLSYYCGQRTIPSTTVEGGLPSFSSSSLEKYLDSYNKRFCKDAIEHYENNRENEHIKDKDLVAVFANRWGTTSAFSATFLRIFSEVFNKEEESSPEVRRIVEEEIQPHAISNLEDCN